jgi:hypothetical protein
VEPAVDFEDGVVHRGEEDPRGNDEQDNDGEGQGDGGPPQDREGRVPTRIS